MVTDNEYAFEIQRCATCNGRWLNHEELDELEATVPSTAEERRATIEYAERPGELTCPACGKVMIEFDYRGYDLELNACPDGEGYWLEAGEEGRIRDIIADRVRGLARAASAEASWHSFLQGLKRHHGGLFGH